MNTLVDMISGMEVKEDDENFLNAVDYMFDGPGKTQAELLCCQAIQKIQAGQRQNRKKHFDFLRSSSGPL